MHYMYCRGKMWQLQLVISGSIAKIGIRDLNQVFGNQEDAADCLAQIAVHDQIPFELHLSSWRVKPLRLGSSSFFYSASSWSGAHYVPYNAWTRAILPIRQYADELTRCLRPVPSDHPTGDPTFQEHD